MTKKDRSAASPDTHNEASSQIVHLGEKAISLIEKQMDALAQTSVIALSVTAAIVAMLLSQSVSRIKLLEGVEVPREWLGLVLVLLFPIFSIHLRRLWSSLEMLLNTIEDEERFLAKATIVTHTWLFNPFVINAGRLKIYSFVSGYLYFAVLMTGMVATSSLPSQGYFHFRILGFTSGVITGVVQYRCTSAMRRIYSSINGERYPLFQLLLIGLLAFLTAMAITWNTW